MAPQDHRVTLILNSLARKLTLNQLSWNYECSLLRGFREDCSIMELGVEKKTDTVAKPGLVLPCEHWQQPR